VGTEQKCYFNSMHVLKISHDEAVNTGFTKGSENNSVCLYLRQCMDVEWLHHILTQCHEFVLMPHHHFDTVFL